MSARHGNFLNHGHHYRNRHGYLFLFTIYSIICRPSNVRATSSTSIELPFIYSSPSPSTREQQIKRTQWIRGKTDELPFIFSSPSTRGQQINRTQRIRGKTDSTIRRTRRGMESLPDIGEAIFRAQKREQKREHEQEQQV